MRGRRKKLDFWGNFLRLVLGLSLILSAVSGIFRPVLTSDVIKSVGEKSWVVQDLNGKLRFLQKTLQGIVDGKVSNCRYGNSVWAIKKDGLLLNSRCTLYKSATEEVSIWGWPLQTAGLLTTGFSCRSFNILSGRVTEWPDGQVGYVIRKANTSWVHQKWDASVVQLDANTWIIEYQRSSILDNSRLYSAAIQFMKHRISRMAKG
ncbi:ERG2/sigma1 receptor-like [Quillaja saponaria]|uniref:ERG2/sigma1 receptor-like n=1 Tax=Quillaja saponaria TaxID=32244 RepID=A0AAD7QEF6_QUISA|nr:ERG2/sigma1 receptor-like [Quillaja saponaria]